MRIFHKCNKTRVRTLKFTINKGTFISLPQGRFIHVFVICNLTQSIDLLTNQKQFLSLYIWYVTVGSMFTKLTAYRLNQW